MIHKSKCDRRISLWDKFEVKVGISSSDNRKICNLKVKSFLTCETGFRIPRNKVQAIRIGKIREKRLNAPLVWNLSRERNKVHPRLPVGTIRNHSKSCNSQYSKGLNRDALTTQHQSVCKRNQCHELLIRIACHSSRP